MAEVVYRVFRVSWGWCAAARSGNGICAVVLPRDGPEAAEAELAAQFPQKARKSRSALRELVVALNRYFDGRRTDFGRFPVDLSGGTEFQQRVWHIARRIPYGQVRTYGWLGMAMGRPKAARAVGSALGANPVPLLVPCHRVVNQDGTLGGFRLSAGGPDLKARLLEMEGVGLTGSGPRRRLIVPPTR